MCLRNITKVLANSTKRDLSGHSTKWNCIHPSHKVCYTRDISCWGEGEGKGIGDNMKAL